MDKYIVAQHDSVKCEWIMDNLFLTTLGIYKFTFLWNVCI